MCNILSIYVRIRRKATSNGHLNRYRASANHQTADVGDKQNGRDTEEIGDVKLSKG